MKKPKEIKLITFDLDDTLWDNMPTITRAEIDTRKYIEERTGKIEWGDLNDFLNLREELIKEDPSIAWDISKLRKEIFRKKLAYVKPQSLRDKIVEEAFTIFINKRHEIQLFDGVENALSELSNKYILGFSLTVMQMCTDLILENILNSQLVLLRPKIVNQIVHTLIKH